MTEKRVLLLLVLRICSLGISDSDVAESESDVARSDSDTAMSDMI